MPTKLDGMHESKREKVRGACEGACVCLRARTCVCADKCVYIRVRVCNREIDGKFELTKELVIVSKFVRVCE